MPARVSCSSGPEEQGLATRPTVLHVTLSRNSPAGIVNQLRDEVQAVVRLGLPWRTVLLTTDAVDEQFAVRLPGGLTPLAYRLQGLRWILNRHRRFDVLLLRHSKVDPVLWMLRRKFANRISIHHTKEIEECRLTTPAWKGFVHSLIERRLGTGAIRSAQAIAGVTHEIVAYELRRIGRRMPAVVAPNGIDMQRVRLAPDLRGGVPTLLFVASRFLEWQGLDILLDAMEESRCYLHLILVGEIDRAYRTRIRRSLHLRSRIVLVGAVDHIALSNLMSEADAGLSSFGLARKGMTEACTLKTREYLSAGLPVYAGHADTGLPRGFAFYRCGMPDIDSIVRQALRWRSHSREEIRAAAEPWIDKTRILSRLYSWICSEFSSRGYPSSSMPRSADRV